MWLIRLLTAALPAVILPPTAPAVLGFAALTLWGGAYPARADVIELRADQWCPFNCVPDSSAPGFMVELAREALAPFGHEVRYANLNWSRSLAEVRVGTVNGVIGTDTDESPDLVFGAPLAKYQEAAVFRRNEARPIATPQDLQGLRLGGIQDYDYAAALLDYIESNKTDPTQVQLLSGDNGLHRNLQKLLNHRIDLILEERSVLLHALNALGLRDQVDVIAQEAVTPLYIGFSPALDSSALYASQLSQGLERLKLSGRYDEILTRYGLEG